MRWLTALFLLVLAMPAAADEPKITYQRFELANGLRVYVVEDHKTPTAYGVTWFRVGSKDEVANRTGFAHLFEHLMFKGSAHLPDGLMDKALLAMSIAVAAGFHLLGDALRDSGEKLFASFAVVLGLLSGVASVVWTSFQLGDFALHLAIGERAAGVASMNNVFDALLFAATALAYLATACLAGALGRVGQLGTPAAHVYLALNLLAL